MGVVEDVPDVVMAPARVGHGLVRSRAGGWSALAQALGRNVGHLEHLMEVAGLDDEDLWRWDMRAWEAWGWAVQAWRSGHRDECPVLPEWMKPLVFPWENDFSVPFPAVAGLWPTVHDWFVEADRHDDFALEAGFFGIPGMPGLEEIRAAWEYAAGEDLAPALFLSIVPDGPWDRPAPAVVGLVEGFAVYGASAEQVDALSASLGDDRRRGEPMADWQAEGRPVVAWEWLIG